MPKGMQSLATLWKVQKEHVLHYSHMKRTCSISFTYISISYIYVPKGMHSLVTLLADSDEDDAVEGATRACSTLYQYQENTFYIICIEFYIACIHAERNAVSRDAACGFRRGRRCGRCKENMFYTISISREHVVYIIYTILYHMYTCQKECSLL